MAIVGCEVSTFSNILIHGLQSLWLARLLAGKMSLPQKSTMLKQIEKEASWKRSWMPPSSARASLWQLHMTRYHDNLTKDIAERVGSKGFNKVAEVAMPCSARDYTDLFQG